MGVKDILKKRNKVRIKFLENNITNIINYISVIVIVIHVVYLQKHRKELYQLNKRMLKYSYRRGMQLFKMHILNGAEIFQCCRLSTVYWQVVRVTTSYCNLNNANNANLKVKFYDNVFYNNVWVVSLYQKSAC